MISAYPYCQFNLGEGAEGVVYRIGENLVVKMWKQNLFPVSRMSSNYDAKDTVLRIKMLEEEAKTFPKDYPFKIVTPIFAGYEIPADGDLYFVWTFHEYLDRATISKSKWEDEVAAYLALKGKFEDVSFDANVFLNRETKELFLIDVVISRIELANLMQAIEEMESNEYDYK